VSFVSSRLGRFAVVGAAGFVLQLLALWALTSVAGWPWLPATAVAVELAVVHNFVWHEHWTWRDRGEASWTRFARFNVATGLTSIVGNIVLMGILVGVMRIPAVIANAIAVGVLSAANFVASDRWVFKSAVVALLLCAPPDAAAAPGNATLNAWTAYAADTEMRLERTRASSARDVAPGRLAADGVSIDVPGGTISHWRGSAFIPGITLDRLLDGLQHPGTPPPQEDVVSSRVIARSGDSLRVAIRLVRHAIVTVSYDTEHEMTFHRWTPALATGRSVATRIEEVGGADHGFLWRLNSYWRYEERNGGVLVELESLTLSRGMPSLLRPVAAPLVRRIARESMVRTLEALRRYFV
jgi:putative flippase GtrA